MESRILQYALLRDKEGKAVGKNREDKGDKCEALENCDRIGKVTGKDSIRFHARELYGQIECGHGNKKKTRTD